MNATKLEELIEQYHSADNDDDESKRYDYLAHYLVQNSRQILALLKVNKNPCAPNGDYP